MPEYAGAFSLKDPEQTGGAIVVGSSYDPHPNFNFVQLSLMALYDYEQIMPHRAPDPLRFKVEGNLGLADDSGKRLLTSINILALYYLRTLEKGCLRPYVEAGVGIGPSLDFQVDGQACASTSIRRRGLVPSGRPRKGSVGMEHCAPTIFPTVLFTETTAGSML